MTDSIPERDNPSTARKIRDEQRPAPITGMADFKGHALPQLKGPPVDSGMPSPFDERDLNNESRYESERKERLRSTIRSRKALYEGLAAIPDASDCPECPGTYGEHYPDCSVGADERWAERVERYIEARDKVRRERTGGNCHICGCPKSGPGSAYCSYPHPREDQTETNDA